MSKSLGAHLGKPIHCKQEEAIELAHPWAKVGVELEMEHHRRNMLVPGWLYKPDGSLRNSGVEYVFARGMYGKALVNAINAMWDVIPDGGWSEGTPRAAIHVHVDITDLNQEADNQFSQFIHAYMVFEHALFGFVGNHRRWCGFCDAIEDSTFEVNEWAKILSLIVEGGNSLPYIQRLSKYQALNLGAMRAFGTVEFRHLPTTFDKERMFDWINIILSFKKFADGVRNESCPLIGQIRLRGIEAVGQDIFKDWWRLLAPYINEQRVERAIKSICMLEQRLKPAPVSFSWDQEVDSPYMKKKKHKASAQLKGPPAEQVRPARQPNVLFDEGARLRVRRMQREFELADIEEAEGDE